ncbi:hypothetical protein B0T26DRAFT_443398 [Lasiosphaeria miniovina]|uniref:Zn(2)-C6 fungal-type domain-containing protein n=1 Tax=Lasiosphaeria miniovina TaxID=1954250 RepID=A0AA39ZYS2_9PEZI|nr:uncharacterized protein B0T26DRAFT_443398 [Lasiosphaeria miniovina]KAK0706108.1 hypothetical protein B0T26DRAFT_443398 [Lasiosphaeria miniovina]
MPESRPVNEPCCNSPREPKKARKSRGKSRLGCSLCKKRRVKCDEVRPACSRCTAHPHLCAYPSVSVPRWNNQVITFLLPNVPEMPAWVARTDDQSNILPQSEHDNIATAPNAESAMHQSYLSLVMTDSSKSFDTRDVFLLVHFTSTTSFDLLGSQKLWAKDAMQLAFQHNFLMHAILALSARHLQEAAPLLSQNCPSYDYSMLEAHHFQRALSGFSNGFNSGTHSTQDAGLATSFVLFFYASAACNADQPPAQACEDASFTFLRGIQTLVANSSSVAHSGLFKTLVAPPLLLPTLFPRAVPVVGPGAALMGLLDGLAASSPFREKRELYVERIESLTSYLSAATRQDIGAEVAEELLLACFRWQAFCPAAFVAATNEQDPIALAVLAHYYAAVELIIRVVKNKFWWWQNKPRHMVKLIGQSIGLAWVAWVAWPMEVVHMLGR